MLQGRADACKVRKAVSKLETDGLYWLHEFLKSILWAYQFNEHEIDLIGQGVMTIGNIFSV